MHIDKDVALVLIYLIFADMVAGGIKSLYVKELSFSFKSFWAGLVRKSLMLLLIMVLALIARGLGFQDFKLKNSISQFIYKLRSKVFKKFITIIPLLYNNSVKI